MKNGGTFLFDATAGDGAAAAPEAAASAPAATTAPGASDGAGTAGDAGSLLAQGAAAASTAAAAADPLGWLHQQHRVVGADGKIDEAASIRKQAENYAPLAARMKEVGAPPKTADEYKFEVPAAMQGSYDPATDPMLADMRKGAHEAGLTQKQFQWMAEQYAQRLPAIVEGMFQQSFDKGQAALRETWKSDAQFTGGLKNAAAAVKGFDPQAFGEGGEVTVPELKSLMNNPWFLKFAAHYGAQMQEDTSPGSPGSLPAGSPYRGMTLAQLESNEAYLNSRHPDHAVVSRMVSQAYHKQTGEDLPV